MGAKVGLLCGVGFLTLFSSALPWLIGRRFKHAMQVLTVGMCFSAGIILGAALSHLLPDAAETWAEYFAIANPDYEDSGYPFAELLAGFALLLLVAIDRLVASHGSGGLHTHEHHHHHNHMVIELPAHYKDKTDDEPRRHSHSHSHSHSHGARSRTGSRSTEMKDNPALLQPSQVESSPPSEASSAPASPPATEAGTSKKEDGAASEGEADLDDMSRQRVLQAWVFFAALSIHSLFDGLGVGAETDENGFYGLLIAVLAHKSLDGFALGVPVFFAGLSRAQTIFALTFSAAMTPLGIGIGMAATNWASGGGGLLAEAIILSISCGTFLFISLIELLPSGLDSYGWVRTKVAAVILGWGIMALIALWV